MSKQNKDLEFITEDQIEVFQGEIPKDEFTFVKAYELTQGVKGTGYKYSGKSKLHTKVKNKKIAEKEAKKDSQSAGLRYLAVTLALEHAKKLALKDNIGFGLGITTIGEPNIYKSIKGVRPLDDAKGSQAYLTIHLNVFAYRKK